MSGRFGFIDPDEKTVSFIKTITDEPFEPLYSDPDCEYEKILSCGISALEPMVAVSALNGCVADPGPIGRRPFK